MSHSHDYSTNWGSNFAGGQSVTNGATSIGATTNGRLFTATIGAAGGAETRPVNAAFHPRIHA